MRSRAGFRRALPRSPRRRRHQAPRGAAAPFGLDPSDPQFWSMGLKVIEGLIDELEAMDEKAKAKKSKH